MRYELYYELYKNHSDYQYNYVCQNNDLNKIVDFLFRLAEKRERQYLIFDNERGQVLGKAQLLSPKEQALMTYHLKIAKYLSQNSRSVLENDFCRAYHEAETRALQEIASFSRR